MATPSLEKAIRALLEPEIAGGVSAFDDVEILLAAWREMHAERAKLKAALREKRDKALALRAECSEEGSHAEAAMYGHKADAYQEALDYATYPLGTAISGA